VAGRFEYRISEVSSTNSSTSVNENMKLWSDKGWELVSGSTASFAVSEGYDRTWHTTYTMFWRKPLPEGQ
jgi:hypothetical protein